MVEYKNKYDFTDFNIGTENKAFNKYIEETINEILPLMFKGDGSGPMLSISEDGKTLVISLEECQSGAEITFTLDDLWEVQNLDMIDGLEYTEQSLKFADHLEEIARKIRTRNEMNNGCMR